VKLGGQLGTGIEVGARCNQILPKLKGNFREELQERFQVFMEYLWEEMLKGVNEMVIIGGVEGFIGIWR